MGGKSRDEGDEGGILEAPHLIRLNRRVLRKAPLALQRRVMRQVLQEILHASSFEQIEKLTALITAPNRSQTDPFPGGAIAQLKVTGST
jgi:tRNA(Ile)-lysidine synthase